MKRKSEEWITVLGQLISISNVKTLQHDKECVETIFKEKESQLDQLISRCK